MILEGFGNRNESSAGIWSCKDDVWSWFCNKFSKFSYNNLMLPHWNVYHYSCLPLCSFTFVIWLDSFVGYVMSCWLLHGITSSIAWHASLLLGTLGTLLTSKMWFYRYIYRGSVSEKVGSSYSVSYNLGPASGPTKPWPWPPPSHKSKNHAVYWYPALFITRLSCNDARPCQHC